MTELLLPASQRPARPGTVWPRTIVCGVDGTRASHEGIRQAAALAGPCGRLQLHVVTRGSESGLSVLRQAEGVARALGVAADLRASLAATSAGGLALAAQGADLIVIGCDTVGPTPRAVLRLAPCSVLLARRPSDLPLFDTLLVAEDDPPRVHELAARLGHAHRGELRLVPRAGLPAAASAIGCGLIVTADVPDAIPLARVAPCSVLVVSDPRRRRERDRGFPLHPVWHVSSVWSAQPSTTSSAADYGCGSGVPTVDPAAPIGNAGARESVAHPSRPCRT